EKFSDRLRATKFLIVEEFVEEISREFQRAGYRIRKDLARKSKLELHGYEFSYAFIAEKFYRFGILIFNPETIPFKKGKRLMPTSLFNRAIYEIEKESKCIGTFVLFDPRLSERSIINTRNLLEKGKVFVTTYRDERFLFVHEIEQGIREFIAGNLNRIELLRDTVEQRLRKLVGEVKKVRDLVIEDSMMVSQLNSLTSGQYLPNRPKSSRLAKLMAPVKNVVDREARNLEIFERKFEDEKSYIEMLMEQFDKRLLLPNLSDLKAKLYSISKLESKFEPIR
ncbi:unnamed protein product, partial [marine sediment metagenome]